MGLSFITPMLLGGASLVAVPLILHLVMRRRPVPHDFPALRFLRQRAVANRRRLQLSHLLLLLLRMAALALLALALSRPVLRGAGWLDGGEGPVAAVLVFDTAPRMLLRDGNRTRLEQAAAMARGLLGRLPPSSRIAVLDTGGGNAAFAPSLAAATARIERLSAATPVATLSATVAAGLRLLEGAEPARHELYVFTDCSHGAWDGAAPLDVAATAPGTSVLCVDVGSEAPQNFALGSLELSGEQLAAGTPLAIGVAATRSGADASRAVAVEILTADGGYARRAMKPVSWTASGPQQVDFEIAGLAPGLRQGRVVIEGDDELEADNARYFTVQVGAPARILVAAPAPAERTARFIVQAIAPLSLRTSGRARFDPQVVDVETLDSVTWDGVRGIVLVDPSPLPPRTWEMLGQWVGEGRGLVVWLGPRAGDAARFNSDASRQVLGGSIKRVWRSPDGGNFLAPAGLDHPLLAAFRRVGDAVPWQDFPVARHWEFEVPAEPPAEGAGAVVAAYRNGLPAVLERRLGRGTIVVVTTPVSQAADDPDAWNTLATGFEPWPFVMLANESLLHAIDTADDRNVATGSPAVLHLDRRDVATAFVHMPTGDDVPVAVDQKAGTITVTATQVPGNYAIRSGGEDGGLARGFSANLDAAATDYTRLEPAALAQALGPNHRLARTEAELVRDVNLERIGAELFGWFVVLAALAMAGDWIAANRFYAPREVEAAGTAAVDEKEVAAPAPVEPPPIPTPPSAVVPPPVPPPPPIMEAGR